MRGGDGEAESGGDAGAGVEAGRGQCGAGRDHRLAQHDQREQAVALGDVGGVEGLALVGDDGQRRRPHQHHHAGRPEQVAARLGHRRRCQPDGAAQRVAGGVAAGEAAPALGVAAGAQEEGGQQQLQRRVGDRELARSAGRDRVHAGGHGDHQAHRGEPRDAEHGVVVVERRGVPGVAHPGPPDRDEQAAEAGDPAPGRVVVEVGGERGDGGDEAQVEEQLEPARVPFLLRVGVAQRRRPTPSRTGRGDGHRGRES